VTLFTRMSRSRILRLPRRVLVAFVLATYLIGGAVHGLCGLDVTNPSLETIMSVADKGVGHGDTGAVADNHCHGCFFMMAEPLVVTARPVPVVARTVASHDTEHRGLPRAIDPRPPKS
jgi:hypothetical protein